MGWIADKKAQILGKSTQSEPADESAVSASEKIINEWNKTKHNYKRITTPEKVVVQRTDKEGVKHNVKVEKKDADGNTVKDKDGKTVYTDVNLTRDDWSKEEKQIKSLQKAVSANQIILRDLAALGKENKNQEDFEDKWGTELFNLKTQRLTREKTELIESIGGKIEHQTKIVVGLEESLKSLRTRKTSANKKIKDLNKEMDDKLELIEVREWKLSRGK